MAPLYTKYQSKGAPPPWMWENDLPINFRIVSVLWPRTGQKEDETFAIVIADVLQSTHPDAPELLKVKDWRAILKGNIKSPAIGAVYEGSGFWSWDDRNPSRAEWNITVKGSMEAGPGTEAELIDFLQQLPAVGPVRAKKLVKSFGLGILETMVDGAERVLRSVLNEKQAKKAADAAGNVLIRQRNSRLLMGAGIDGLAKRELLGRYKEVLIRDVLVTDPLVILAQDGVSFEQAQSLWALCGLKKDDMRIIGAGASYVLSRHTNHGHCFVRPNAVFRSSPRNKGLGDLLEIPGLEDRWYTEDMPNHPDVAKFIRIDKFGSFWPKELWDAENKAVDKLLGLMDSRPIFSEKEIIRAQEYIQTISEQGQVKISEEQIDAVLACLSQPVTLVTGSAGTGKTTIQKVLVLVLQRLGISDIQVMAPTGKAARNATKKIGMAATTAHTALEYVPGGVPSRNESDPFSARFIIVDEVGMVDIKLFSQILNAVAFGSHIVLVGDPQQLPAVGPGKVLDDLIQSGIIPQSHLTKTFRQDANSKLLDLCYAVLPDPPKRMRLTDRDGAPRFPDIEEVPLDTPKQIIDWVKHQYQMGADPDTFKFLCGYKGKREEIPEQERTVDMESKYRYVDAGVTHINMAVCDLLFPAHVATERIKLGDFYYAPGMRCIWLRNIVKQAENDDEILNMVNGQDFTILEFAMSDEGTIQMVFETLDAVGNKVEYTIFPTDYRDFFMPAYCLTVHKSQGSEFPQVAFIIRPGDARMLSKALVYTAITRATQKVYIVGDTQAIWEAPARDLERNTGLTQKLRYFARKKIAA